MPTAWGKLLPIPHNRKNRATPNKAAGKSQSNSPCSPAKAAIPPNRNAVPHAKPWVAARPTQGKRPYPNNANGIAQWAFQKYLSRPATYLFPNAAKAATAAGRT